MKNQDAHARRGTKIWYLVWKLVNFDLKFERVSLFFFISQARGKRVLWVSTINSRARKPFIPESPKTFEFPRERSKKSHRKSTLFFTTLARRSQAVCWRTIIKARGRNRGHWIFYGANIYPRRLGRFQTAPSSRRPFHRLSETYF